MTTSSLETLRTTQQFGQLAHLPVWDNFEPATVKAALAAAIEEAETAFTVLEEDTQPTWEGLLLPLERIGHELGQLFGWSMHLLSVRYSDELQAAYDAVRDDYVRLANRMSQSRAIYDQLRALVDSTAFAALNTARQRIVTEAVRGMERSGVHLDGAERDRYQAISQRLSELSNDFSTHLIKEEQGSRINLAATDAVAGIPAPLLELAAQTARDDGIEDATAEQGPWHFVINAVNYLGVAQNCTNRATRERFYRAFRQRGTTDGFDNRPIVAEILALRQESSQLVGFANYAAYSTDSKMAGSPAAVWSLLDELETAARPVAEAERDELVAFMRKTLEDASIELEPWDVTFWSERLQEERYGYDSEQLRDYFQLPRVMNGLFDLINKLYDVEVAAVDRGSVPVWHDSVDFYEVRRQGTVIAGFFVDPFARPGEKRGGAWMNDVVGRAEEWAPQGQAAALPVALFVMNARPPADGKPALLSLDDVRTLFHEFGHATQHMFTEINEGGAAGMNLVEWDAVELASQFNEYWMDHKPFLKALSAHVDSGEPLAEDTLEQIISSRNFMAGSATLRQLYFAKTDLKLHEQFGLDAGENRTPAELEQATARETLVLPQLPDESQLPAFGHLFAGGYAAGYYSYKWAEVLAADAFAAFREVGLENENAVREVADRFRTTVLALGGSRPAAEVYRLFRGRDASPAALLEEQGLVAATGAAHR
ncbi:MAG: M3 family metallopeptidase [Pseudomonadota bacterium]